MSASFQLTPKAIEDLDEIWRVIAEENRKAAEQVETEILVACRRLATHPDGNQTARHYIVAREILDHHEVP